MVSHIAKARAAAEELKGLLVCNSVEETAKRIDKLLMVLILRSLHPDYEHVRDQILSSEQIPSMNSLVIRLLRVPTITKGDGIVAENSAMVTSRRGRSGRRTRGMSRNGKGGRGDQVIPNEYAIPKMDLLLTIEIHKNNKLVSRTTPGQQIQEVAHMNIFSEITVGQSTFHTNLEKRQDNAG
ncbi:hypothetical protein CR513_52926, partial [Mucuna pruriens]